MTQIKVAKPKHLEALNQLFDGYRRFYRMESDLEASKTFLKERLENADSVIYMAEYDDEFVGFVQLYPIFSSTQMKRLWLLNDLFVKATHRGKGISKSLIEKAKDLAKETNAYGLMLETEKTNTIGNFLYPKMGFKLDQEHHFYTWKKD